MNIYRIGKWCGIVLSAAGLGLVSGSVIGQTNLWHGYPRLSPFEEVRWTPQVKVGGTWYALVSVNGVSVEKMRDYCQSAGDSEHFWQKHFGEDMVEILSHVSSAPGTAVDLEVRDLSSGQTSTLSRVAMTEPKRAAILKSDWDIR